MKAFLALSACAALVLLPALAAGADARASAAPFREPLADYTVTTWSDSDGLPAGRIRAIKQDADGYLWLATDEGLIRFDGDRFDEWEGSGHAHLPPGQVTALLSARDRSLWVGVGGASPVGRVQNGAVTFYGEREGFGGYVLSLLEDRAGSVWAGTSQGLLRFRGAQWQKVGADVGLGPGAAVCVYEDRQGRLWVATLTAVFRKAPDADRFEQVDVHAVASNFWQSFSEDADGTVWISDFREGARAPGRHVSLSGGRRRGWGAQLLHDRRGTFWIATQGQGLWRSRAAGSGHGVVEAITINDGLSSDSVQALFEDREGNLWVGARTGLQRLSPRRVKPVKNLPVTTAIAATPDGSVWVGTAAGLIRFSATGRIDYGESQGLPGSLVLALHADEHGGLLVSTERGLTRFAHGRFSPLLLSPDRIHRVIGMTASAGTVWLRDFDYHLFRWTGGQLSAADDLPDMQGKVISTTYADGKGALWIASAGRVAGRRADGRVESYDAGLGRIDTIFEDGGGTVWIGGEQGLGRFSDGRFQTVTRRHGFPGNVRTIIEDELGALWIGASSGILRLDKQAIERSAGSADTPLRFELFNSADGVAGAPISGGSRAAVRAGDGKLWFVTTSGVTIVDPRHLGDPRRAPAVKVESIRADSRLFDPAAGLQLPARTSHVQIAFAAQTLTDPTRIRYRYRLDGVDRDWVDAGVTRQASYSNLPPGPYRFRVMAGGAGAWLEPGTAWSFAIEPMFYQTAWFRAAAVATLFLIVFAAWRLHLRQVRRQFALVIAERIRMSRAIHDTLLQGLAALALQVDDLSHTVESSPQSARTRMLRIRRQVEDSIRQARQSIWDLRSPFLASRTLPWALREAGERAIDGRAVELDVTVSGAAVAPNPAVDEQLLLIGQEALNNAVRHAGATRVAIELDYGGETTRLVVRDDGCGFDPDEARRANGHYGLLSMRERAEQVRGRFTVVSVPGQGTAIEAVVPK